MRRGQLLDVSHVPKHKDVSPSLLFSQGHPLTMENTDAERLLSERRHGGHDQQFERAMDNTDAERLLASDPLERRPDTDIRQYRSIYWTRLILRVLSFATCIAILYYLITGILVYKRTKDVKNPYVDGSGSFDVWPPGLKLWPSYILLGAALGAAVLNLILLFASCFKKVPWPNPIDKGG